MRQFVNCVTAFKGLESAGLHFPADSEGADRLGCLSASGKAGSCPPPLSSHPSSGRHSRRERSPEPSRPLLRPSLSFRELLGPSCHCQPSPDFQAFLGLWLGPAYRCQKRGFLESSRLCGLDLRVLWSGGAEGLGALPPQALGKSCCLPPPHRQLTLMRPRRRFIGRHCLSAPRALHY